MAYKASLQLLLKARDGGSMLNGNEPFNACNFNDLLDRQATRGYWKPRFAEWPIGGYTLKEAHTRMATGKLETSPGSFEWSGK